VLLNDARRLVARGLSVPDAVQTLIREFDVPRHQASGAEQRTPIRLAEEFHERRLGVNTTGSAVCTANVAPTGGLERNVGQRAAHGERNRSSECPPPCDGFGSAERR
jgi:hypothetical protein